jgi:hypothetical protein
VALDLADEADDQRAVRAAPSPPATGHLRAGVADAHIGDRRMAGRSSKALLRRLADCRRALGDPRIAFEFSTTNCTARFRFLHLQKIYRRIFPLG